MDVIAKDRQQGKTTELIRIAARDFLYVVCPSRDQVRHIQRMALEMGLEIPFPLTWEEFRTGRYYGKGVNGFVIDNLDMCIQTMTPVPIRAVSLNATEPAQAR